MHGDRSGYRSRVKRFWSCLRLGLWLVPLLSETLPNSIAKNHLAAADWPTFLGPQANSTSTETGVAPWPPGGPPVLWQIDLGEGYASCAVAGGSLYQFDAVDGTARLRSLNPQDGTPRWTFEYRTSYADLYGYDGGPRCMPVVDDDRVYIYGVEGMLHCLNARDGSVVWKVDVNSKFGVVQNFFGVGSTPLVSHDKLIVMVGGSPPDAQQIPPGQLDRVTGNGSAIVAFDKRTGTQIYQLSDELASYASPMLATWDGQRRCLAFLRGGLLIFDPDSGQQEYFFPWRSRKLESVNASNPVVVGAEILLSETYGPGAVLLRRQQPGKYEVVWSDESRGRDKSLLTHWNTPIYHDRFVYASSGRHTGNAELRCVEWSTGKVRWSVPNHSRSSLLYVDQHFVSLGEFGTLRLLKANPDRYEEVSVVDLTLPGSSTPLLDYPAWAAPVLSDGRLYVRGKSRLVCLQMLSPQP